MGEEGGGKPSPKDEKGLKEWIKNKLKALSSLPGRSGVKAQKHCLVSLECFSAGSSIKPQAQLVGYPKIYGLWL